MREIDILQYHDSGVKQGYCYFMLVDIYHGGNFVCNLNYSNHLVSYLPSVEKIGFHTLVSDNGFDSLTIYKEPRGNNYGLESSIRYSSNTYRFFL